jgi:hypothetical protein
MSITIVEALYETPSRYLRSDSRCGTYPILAVELTKVDLVRFSFPASVNSRGRLKLVGGNYAETNDGRGCDLVPRGVWRA